MLRRRAAVDLATVNRVRALELPAAVWKTRPWEPEDLWDLDARVGVEAPWGVAPDHVAAVEAHTAR
jgi:hypothetical protein